MKNLRIWMLLIANLFLISQSSREAKAVDLITNGSFETGTFAGWTAVNAVGSWFDWQNTTAATGNTGFHASSPQHGTRSAWNGVAANAGGTYTLSQQVSIPAGNAAVLSWKHRLQLDNSSFCSPVCGTATFEVQILNTSNVVQQTIYSVVVGNGQIYDSGWVTNNVNISAYAGRTIIIRFRNTVTVTLAGPGMAEIDQVALNAFVPTAGEAAVGGRVLTAGGQGIRNAVVTITAPNGETRSTTTGSFGFYRFDDIEVGAAYVVSVSAKRFRFAEPARILSVNENVADFDFVAIE